MSTSTEVFLNSLSLLNKDLCDSISNNEEIIESQELFNDHCSHLNQQFFDDRFVVIGRINYEIIPPVSLVSSHCEENRNYKFAFFTLNPGLDTNFIEDELFNALYNNRDSRWQSYAEYYTSGFNDNPNDDGFEGGVYNQIIPGSDYYRKRIALMNGINEGFFTLWSKLVGNSVKDKKKFAKKFFENNPVVVSNFVPFHSTNFKTIGVNQLIRLYNLFDEYRHYNEYIFSFLFEKISNDGFLFVEGKAAKEVFFFMNPDALNDFYHFDENMITTDVVRHIRLSLGRLNGKQVVVLHHFFGQQGAFNHQNQIQALIENINNFF